MVRTYGKILLEPGRNARWIIKDLAPHVAIAFKRLFPRVDKYAEDLALSDSDDVRADLCWFMQRYPLETKHAAMLKAGERAVKARAALRGEILNPDWTPPPANGRIREDKAPYLYQSQAARIAVDQGGLLLADEVGLGKTEAALTALAYGAPLPAAVVVQSHLATQWMMRVEAFTTFTCHVIYKTTPYTLPPADIYIFKYSNVAGWIDFIKNGYFKSVIYDEIQELRAGNDSAKGRCCSIMSARAKFRMGLTATATYNYGDEIHTIMEYLNPEILGEREEFVREWCTTGRIVVEPDALGEFLKESGWMLRRTEDDPMVDASMPRPNIIPVEVGWNEDDADADDALIRKLALRVVSGSFQAGSAARELDIYMRKNTGVAKARAVAAYVRMLLQDTPRVLIAGWHRDVYAIWYKALQDFKPMLYTGSENSTQKQRAINHFTVGQSRVMFISLRSGAGLDGLQHYCRDVVIGEFDWSPQVHHQVIGRLRRPGQQHQVTAHFPYVNEGSDPVLMEINGVKSDQARGIHDPGVIQHARVTDETRVKRLAQYILEQEAPEDTGCGICGAPSTGQALNIIPLAEAEDYPAGPEREALFGPDNIWFLCAEHARLNVANAA